MHLLTQTFANHAHTPANNAPFHQQIAPNVYKDTCSITHASVAAHPATFKTTSTYYVSNAILHVSNVMGHRVTAWLVRLGTFIINMGAMQIVRLRITKMLRLTNARIVLDCVRIASIKLIVWVVNLTFCIMAHVCHQVSVRVDTMLICWHWVVNHAQAHANNANFHQLIAGNATSTTPPD